MARLTKKQKEAQSKLEPNKVYMGLTIDRTLYNFLILTNILQDFYTECQRHNPNSDRTHSDLKTSFYWSKTFYNSGNS